MAEAHRRSLFAKIRKLATGNFVLVESRGARLRTGVKRRVVSSNGLPIVGTLVEGFEVELGVARRVFESRDDGVQIRLAGSAAHRGNRGVRDVHARVGGLEDGSSVRAAGIVRVKMDGNFDLL